MTSSSPPPRPERAKLSLDPKRPAAPKAPYGTGRVSNARGNGPAPRPTPSGASRGEPRSGSGSAGGFRNGPPTRDGERGRSDTRGPGRGPARDGYSGGAGGAPRNEQGDFRNDGRNDGRNESRGESRPSYRDGAAQRPQSGAYGSGRDSERNFREGGRESGRAGSFARDGGREGFGAPQERGFDRGADRNDPRGGDRGGNHAGRGETRAGGFGRDGGRDTSRPTRRDLGDRQQRPQAEQQERPAGAPAAKRWTHNAVGVPATGPIPVKRPPETSPDGPWRLNKRMADLGMCSRREADEWVERGWVRVNGEVAEMGVKVVASDRISIDRAAQERQDARVTILLHKPMGYVSGQPEDGHEPAVALLSAETHWAGDTSRTRFAFGQLQGLAPAGRLDIDSVGLLVLTQDGRVARQIIGEDSEMDKEYLVRVTYGDIDTNVQAAFPADQIARLCHGLSLDGEELLPAQVEWQNPEQLRFVLRQGKKRQIRRMCELVGLRVVGLKRIRIGGVTLGNLPVGRWRYLGENEQF